MYCAQLASIVQGDDDPMGDGSNESEASIKWPLDGSAAAGIDVFHYMGKLALRHMLPVKVPPGLLRCDVRGRGEVLVFLAAAWRDIKGS